MTVIFSLPSALFLLASALIGATGSITASHSGASHLSTESISSPNLLLYTTDQDPKNPNGPRISPFFKRDGSNQPALSATPNQVNGDI